MLVMTMSSIIGLLKCSATTAQGYIFQRIQFSEVSQIRVTIIPTHTGGEFLLSGTDSAHKLSISLKSLTAMSKVNKIYATKNFNDL